MLLGVITLRLEITVSIKKYSSHNRFRIYLLSTLQHKTQAYIGLLY